MGHHPDFCAVACDRIASVDVDVLEELRRQVRAVAADHADLDAWLGRVDASTNEERAVLDEWRRAGAGRDAADKALAGWIDLVRLAQKRTRQADAEPAEVRYRRRGERFPNETLVVELEGVGRGG